METTPKIRCLVLEDEQLGLVIMKDYIGRIPFLELTAVTTNGAEALKIIESQPFDLLFLDIQVPAITGIELLQSLENPPKAIFTTAFPGHAAKAFDLEAIDYLVKPISFERFEKAVFKALKLSAIIDTAQTHGKPLQTPQNSSNAFIYLKSGGVQVKIVLGDILLVESQRNQLLIHLSDPNKTDRQITTYLTINELEDRLPKALFVRIHKSFIVAIDKIEAYNATTVTIAGMSYAIGRSYKEEAMRVIGR